MPQGLLPFFPAGTTYINSLVSFEKRDQTVTYFNHSMPIFSHSLNDEGSFRMFVSQLYVNGIVKQTQIVKAFGVSDTAVKRWVKLYRKCGPEGFYENRRTGSKPRILTSEVLEKAQHLLYDGLSPKKVGESLGVKYDTIRKAISTKKLKKKSSQQSYPIINV